MAKVMSIAGRNANLVGYDPQTIKSDHLSIVTALLKTVSADNVLLLLQVNEAVYNQHSLITLLAEYQMQEFGLIVDSVATKHNSAPNVPGTQTLYVSDVVRCPLVDRGGLMALVLHPVEDGDEDKYEIFDVTSDYPWTPCHYMHNAQACKATAPLAPSILQDIPDVSSKTPHFDPGNNEQLSYGITAKL
jgi:hypothetical protein